MDTNFNFVNIHLNGGDIKIQLLDSPAVNVWKQKFASNHNNLNRIVNNSKIQNVENPKTKFGSPENLLLQQDNAVDKINVAISNVNKSITGKEFPYYAFVGMPWAHTNRIHRAFTTGRVSEKNWYHYMTEHQLLEYKKKAYSSKSFDFVNMPRDFKVLDHSLFATSLEIINHWVHIYEGTNISKRAVDLLATVDGVPELEFNMNNTLETGEKTSVDYARITYEDVKRSIPNNYDDYDVVIGVEITGKCYETCYVNYDDPMEYDITNLDNIDGSFNLRTTKTDFYSTSAYMKYIKGYIGLEDEMILPIPIGKIIHKDFDIQYPKVNTEEKYLDGTYKYLPPFDTVSFSVE